MSEGVKYVTVSIPKAVADRIDYLIAELGLWRSRSFFVREASLEKFYREMQNIDDLWEFSVEPVLSLNGRETISEVSRRSSEVE